MQIKSDLLLKHDQVFYQNLRQLQQSTLETLIQVILILLSVWYFIANLLGESINLPQLSVSLIPAVIGSWWALRWLSGRLEVALTIWMLGLAAMMGLSGYFTQRPELLLILLPLSTIGVLVVDWWYGLLVVALFFVETWWLGGAYSAGEWVLTTDLQTILLGGLIGVIVGWAISRSLLVASSWAVAGYLKVQVEMDETRKNQMELKQVQEDLLHANNELARLTERLKVLHQVAEEARQVKEQFVANVSHELRTPLNMIISFSEMIMQSPQTYKVQLPPELMADISAIQRNSQHLSKLVNDVFSLSQIEVGRMALTREWVCLPEIVEEAVIAVGALYTSKGIYLETDIPSDLPSVFCDSTRIRQVVLNLLSNAGRFTEKGGVRVKTSLEGEGVCVQVADTGPGIAPENQDMVFQPFQQLDGLVQRRYGGSGLGLSAIPFLSNPTLAKPSLVVVSMWTQGAAVVIFLAALQDVPRSLYEATTVDGANNLQKFWNVTIPITTPVILFNLIMGFIGAFQEFTVPWLLTGGSPMNSTEFYAIHLYRKAFIYLRMGKASVLAWILFFIIVFFTLILFRTSARWVYYGGDEG